MTSRMAIDDLAAMRAEGLCPTDDDIIRLNAIGCRVEYADNPIALYRYRRTAKVGKLTLREPTIAHDLWLGEALREYDQSDEASFVILRLYALSRDASELPKDYSASELKDAIERLLRDSLNGETFARCTLALEYVLFGTDSNALEVAKEVKGRHSKEIDDPDGLWSFEIGLVHEAECMGLGISFADAINHTRAELNAIIERAIVAKYGPSKDSRKAMEYYATRDEIAERLRKEKENGRNQI